MEGKLEVMIVKVGEGSREYGEGGAGGTLPIVFGLDSLGFCLPIIDILHLISALEVVATRRFE